MACCIALIRQCSSRSHWCVSMQHVHTHLCQRCCSTWERTQTTDEHHTALPPHAKHQTTAPPSSSHRASGTAATPPPCRHYFSPTGGQAPAVVQQVDNHLHLFPNAVQVRVHQRHACVARQNAMAY